MIDRDRLKLERAFLYVEQRSGAFCVFSKLDPPEYALEGVALDVFSTEAEAERYIAAYGSEAHVAEFQAHNERERREMARTLTIRKLLRAPRDD
jgi:hypothetical protein